MPRSATIIFGLVAVAVSIGFNVWRYPIVWRMTGPTATPTVTAPAATPAAANTPAVSKVEPPAVAESPPAAHASPQEQPSKPTVDEPKPATPPLMMAAKSEPKPVHVVPKESAAAVAPPAAGHGPAALASIERPMVPVPKIAATTKPDVAAEVRRLPPVDPNMPRITRANEPGGAIRIYPSTGIE
jgi:hypothetical protein